MSQKLYVDLEFRANTDSAKKKAQELQKTLNQAINASMNRSDLGLTPQLEKARLSAMQLKSALDSATNVDTGKLNLHKFTNQLRTAGLDMKTLARDMQALGPEGQKAFGQMTQALASAETKIFSVSSGMHRLVSTFANTMRYQVSAAAIQGVTQAISGAISYTKELDKSLTDIQIVTGKSSAEMERFAVQANKAAKSLSVATNEYVKASHIYFQQGLDTGEAMKRAESTIKLAHATGESMEEVSNWMTAIWNNFDNGTKSLEYYGDVLAKLGAATASSADEIAQGLNKFASVAETVGLSYEYAASALATITAETRQSADVVGTALKTLFARMEGLKLGETLDDGTTMNQYSLALEAVGVSIKDANGELKNMDTILDEAAVKWTTLSKDQQVALAQSVAGVRQYTQFIALMDNYDVMQANIKMSKASAGELQKMQEQYEQSLEGLKDKTQAAKEELIGSLLDEESLKTFQKSMAKIMEFATKLSKSFGGLQGILLMAASALTKMYQPQIATMFTNIAVGAKDVKTNVENAGTSVFNMGRSVANGVRALTGQEQKELKPLKPTSAEAMRDEAFKEQERMETNQMGGVASATINKEILKMRQDLVANDKKLTQGQKDQLNWQIQLLEKTRDTLVEEEKRLEVMRQENLEKADAVNAGVSEQDISRKMNAINTLSNSGAAAEGLLSTNITADNRADIGTQLVGQLQAAQRAAQELGLNIKDMGFEDAIGDAQLFADGSIEDFDRVGLKVLELNEKIQNAAAYQRAGMSGAEAKIDTTSLQNRGEQLGLLEHSAEQTANMAKNADPSKLTSQEGKSQLAQQMQESLNKTKLQAEELGLNIKDLGFEDATNDIANFAKEGGIKIDELIRKMEEFQNKVRGGIQSDMTATVEDEAAMAAADSITGGAVTDMKSGDETKAAEGIKKMKDSGLIDPDQAKKASDLLKKYNKQKKETADLEKKAADIKKKGGKLTKEEQSLLDKSRKKLKNVNKEYNNEIKAMSKGAKTSSQYNNILKDRGGAMQDSINSSKNLAKSEADLKTKIDSVVESAQRSQQILQGAASGVQKFGQGMSTALSTGMQLASGFNMLTNGVASLSGALRSGSKDWSDYLTAAMSILPGLMQIIGPVTKVISLMLAKAAATKVDQKASKQHADGAVADAAKEKAAETTKKTSKISSAIANVVNWFTKGPGGWVIGAVGVAALAAAGIGLAISAGNKKAKNEETEKEMETEREVVSQANEVSKGLTGLSEQVDTFKNLRESGQSTISVLEDMTETINSINSEIDELLKKSREDADWTFLSGLKSELATAVENLKNGVGDINELEKTIANAQQKIGQASAQSSYETYKTSRSMYEGTDDEKVKEDLTTFTTQVGSALENNQGLMDAAVNKFLAAKNTYQTGEEAERAWADAAIKTILGDDASLNNFGNQDLVISSLLSAAPGSVHRVVNGLNMLATNGSIYNKYGANKAEAIKGWASPDDPRFQYLDQIDFSSAKYEDWEKGYREAVEQQNYAQKKQKAEKYEMDESAFENYTEAVMENNKELQGNEDLAAELGLQTIRLSTGIKKLKDKFSELSDVFKKGQSAGFEYSKSLSELATIMTETFGFKIDANQVDKYMGTIRTIMYGGEQAVYALDNLRDSLSKDYINDFNYQDKNDKGEGLDKDQQKNVFSNIRKALLQDPNADISGYYDELNEMLKAGQVTKEDIEELFSQMSLAIELPDQITHNGITVAQLGENTKIVEGPNSEELLKANNPNKDKEIDRFYEIKELLSDIEREFSKINKARSRAFGQSKLTLYDQEIEKQKELVAAEEEYRRQMEEALKEDVSDLNWRFKIDEETGRILNYTEVLNQLKEEGNYDYDDIKESADKYTESLNNLEEQQEKVTESIYALADLELEKISAEVELQVRLSDNSIKYLEWLTKEMDDPLYDAMKTLVDMDGILTEKGKKVDATFKGIKDTIVGINPEFAALFKDLDITNMSAEQLMSTLATAMGETPIDDNVIKKIEDFMSSLYDLGTDVNEFYSDVMSHVSNAFEEMVENGEKASGRIEQLGSSLEIYSNIVDLIGSKSLKLSTEQLERLGAAQIKQAQADLNVKMQRLKTQEAYLKEAQEQYESAFNSGDATLAAYWKQQVDNYQDSVHEMQGEVESTFEGVLQSIADEFVAGIERATNSFKDTMGGAAGTLEHLQEMFNQQKELADLYVDDYQKIYELSKLNRDINKSIDTSDSIKGKQILRDLQEEINEYEKDGKKMSEHDLEYLRKKYELKMAEIALEEAQNAKSTVRMRRDSEGNWSYVYTADEDKTEKAQQNFEDKLYQIQKLEQDYINEIQDRIIQSQIDMAEAINNIRRKDYASQKEYEEEVTRVTKHYTDLQMGLRDELLKALDNSKEIYESDWAKYSEASGYKISAEQEWRKEFKDTEYSILTGFPTMEAANDAFKASTQRMVQNVVDEYGKWANRTNETLGAIGSSIDKFGQEGGTLDTAIDKVINVLDKVVLEFGTYAGAAETGFQDIIAKAQELLTSFSPEIQKWTDEISKVTEGLTEWIELAAQVKGTKLPTNVTGTENLKTPGGYDPSTYTIGADGKVVGYYGITNNKGGIDFYKAGSFNSIEQADQMTGQIASSHASTTGSQVAGTYFANPNDTELLTSYTTGVGGKKVTTNVIEVGQQKSPYYWNDNTTSKLVYGQGHANIQYLDSNNKKQSMAIDLNEGFDIQLGGYVNEYDYSAIEYDGNVYNVHKDEIEKKLLKTTANTKGYELYTDANGKDIFLQTKNNKVKNVQPSRYGPVYNLTTELGQTITVHKDELDEILNKLSVTGDAAKWGKSGGGDDYLWQDNYIDEEFEKGDRLKMKNSEKGQYVSSVYWKKIYKSGSDTTPSWEGYVAGNRWGLVPAASTVLDVTDIGNGIKGYYTGLITSTTAGGIWAVGDKDGNYLYSSDGKYYETSANSAWSKVWYTKDNDNLESYDTGGYTGSWDSSGRLALLHQKEIILNASDTENFLAAINIVRDIAKAIDLKAAAYQYELASRYNATNLQSTSGVLQQDITIHAEFPNARERSEIEAAFDNLLNRASQFANRKN